MECTKCAQLALLCLGNDLQESQSDGAYSWASKKIFGPGPERDASLGLGPRPVLKIFQPDPPIFPVHFIFRRFERPSVLTPAAKAWPSRKLWVNASVPG